MKQLHAIRAHLSQIGRCAFVGTLVGLMAAQAVAQSAPTPAATSEATPALPLTVPSSATPVPSLLPDAPSAVQTASLAVPSGLNLMLANSRQASQSLQTTSPISSGHKVKPGWLVLAAVGAVGVALGAYIYTLPAASSKTGEKMALGTVFLAPGAAAAGFGFYFAFHQKN